LTPKNWKNTMKKHWEITREILIREPEICKNDLFKKSGYGNKTKYYEFLKEWKIDDLIKIEQVGNEKRVYLPNLQEKVNTFFTYFDKRLDDYEKMLNKNLTALKKNKPLINPKQAMKSVKIKRPIPELKIDGVIQNPKKTEYDDHTRTWNPRKKPLMYFETILDLLNQLYQESSVLTFGTSIHQDSKKIKDHQVRTEKLIEHTIKEIENMFYGETDYVFVVNQIRTSLYGLIYKATLKAEIKKG